MKQRQFKPLKQKGFTLIELIIVVTIIGIIATIVARQIGIGITDTAKAVAMYESANKLSQNWSLLAQTAGTSTLVSSSPLVGTGKTAEDVLIEGSTAVATAYQKSYKQSALIPLTDIAQGSAGAYTIHGYQLTFGGGGSAPLSITFANVPDPLVLAMVQKHGSNVATLATSDTTNGVIQYGTATNEVRNVTILKPN